MHAKLFGFIVTARHNSNVLVESRMSLFDVRNRLPPSLHEQHEEEMLPDGPGTSVARRNGGQKTEQVIYTIPFGPPANLFNF